MQYLFVSKIPAWIVVLKRHRCVGYDLVFDYYKYPLSLSLPSICISGVRMAASPRSLPELPRDVTAVGSLQRPIDLRGVEPLVEEQENRVHGHGTGNKINTICSHWLAFLLISTLPVLCTVECCVSPYVYSSCDTHS